MTASEILSNKIQELLGDKYKIFAMAQFQNDYTTAVQIVDGSNVEYVNDYTDEYTKLRKNNIIGIVSISQPTPANADFYYVASNYEIKFSVPTNLVKRDINGKILETPKFAFFADMETLSNKIRNTKLNFGNNLYGKMTASEPLFVSNESDGELKYSILTINGAVVISDKARFGSEYSVNIKVNGNYVELDNINSYAEILNNDTNAIVLQNTTKTEQDMAQSGWVATIGIDDIETSNTARQEIYSLIHNNGDNGRLLVKIIEPSGYIHEFNAIVSISFSTSRNGIGTYQISFTDDNKGV